MNRKTITLLGFLIIAVIAFMWGYRLDLFNEKEIYTGSVEEIRIGNIGEYSIFNIIALEKGYFRENGLDAQIIEYPSGPPAVQDLLAGKVDFAVAADFVGVRNIFINPDLRILTQASKHKVFHLLARKDRGIVTPSDLKGKTVGVTRKGAGEFYLGRFLLLNNLQLEDIVIRDLTPQQMMTQLENGSIDAIVIFDPHAYNLKKTLGETIVSWSAQGDQNIFALVYSTNSYLKAHPNTAARYMRALLQAELFVKESPPEAKDFIAKKLHYDPDYIEYLWSHFTFEHRLDQELLLTMEDESRWVIENKLTDQTSVPNYLPFIYFDALEKINPDVITIIR